MRRWRALGIITAAPTMTALIWAASIPARADEIPPCAPPQSVQAHTFPDGLPLALRSALKNQLGEIVPPGERFDATDVVITGKNRRAIFVWARGQRWVVATEHGGRGYNDPVFAFDMSANASKPMQVAAETAFPHTVCATARKLIGQ
jgi:hypothetical protein